LLAHDSAARAAIPILGVATYHTPILVLDFLRHLHSSKHAGTVLGVQNAAGTTIEEQYGKAFVHFTHFIKVDNPGIITAEFLANSMKRGVGIICADRQEGVDIVLPVSMDGTLNATSISSLKLQARDGCARFDASVHDALLKLELLDDHMELKHEGFNFVFSFGAEPSVQPKRVTDASRDVRKRSPLLGFNLFVGGRSGDVFSPLEGVQSSDVDVLLRQENMFPDVYAGGLDKSEEQTEHLLRSMNPLCESHPVHWSWLRPPQTNED